VRSHGLRATTQRVLVLDGVAHLHHPTVDALHASLAQTGIALTTVYRTLDTLEESGLVWAPPLPHTGRVYHLAGRHNHAHVTCRRCGWLHDIDTPVAHPSGLDVATSPGFAVDLVQVVGIGCCGTCALAVPSYAESRRSTRPSTAPLASSSATQSSEVEPSPD
jgi:Fur family ferric uptake transcriptional regulator